MTLQPLLNCLSELQLNRREGVWKAARGTTEKRVGGEDEMDGLGRRIILGATTEPHGPMALTLNVGFDEPEILIEFARHLGEKVSGVRVP